MIWRYIFSGIYFGTQIFITVSNFFEVEEADHEVVVAGWTIWRLKPLLYDHATQFGMNLALKSAFIFRFNICCISGRMPSSVYEDFS